ncbi:hypothetical protein QYM36_017262 [Artemia franciscana]|uniref:Uncharacterized protein n=1 Tax=Artemia franciscana TaxID=6661 RepID=A0AA88H7N2_ARTSF|nr:hypothetical protein QYM36_017262 [Artemia franciscana]
MEHEHIEREAGPRDITSDSLSSCYLKLCLHLTGPISGKRPCFEETSGRCQFSYISCSFHAEVSFEGGSKGCWRRTSAHDMWLNKKRMKENLNELHTEVFKKKVTTASTFVHPEQLPPTSDAAKFYSYSVVYQVQVWSGDPDSKLKAEECGWKNKDDFLYPLTTNPPLAPRLLLKVVKCSCLVECISTRCGCFKNG